MNTRRILAAIATLICFTFNTAAFAQSGTISFTGRISAPACTASITHSTQDDFDLSLNACANSQALVARSSVSTNTNTNTNTSQTAYLSTNAPSTRYNTNSIPQDNNSAIITVTYE